MRRLRLLGAVFCMILLDLALLLGLGLLAGTLAERLGLPRLIGLIVLGLCIGPQGLDLLSAQLLSLSAELRLLALMIILLNAGLGLDRESIVSQGSVAIRLAFMPAVIEASVVAAASRWIFGWEWLYCWLLGWIVCAASPAVIVPMMLQLKAQGLGQDKGIPDLILAGGTLSDGTAIVMFGITLGWLGDGNQVAPWLMLGTIPVMILGGVTAGYLAGRLARWLLGRGRLTVNTTQDFLVAAVLAAALILGEQALPYSGFLAVMVMGFVILESDRIVARRLRQEAARAWVIAEIALFGLLGAAVDITVVRSAGLAGAAVVLIGLAVGRWLGIFAATAWSRITLSERAFMVVGDMAKATVQAAIGGIPLAMGVAHGEVMLAISVLAILITAPIGAAGTAYLAPRMLQRGEVDPTKVSVREQYRFLVGVDGSEAAVAALRRATALSRQAEGSEVVLLHVRPNRHAGSAHKTLARELELVSDVPHRLEIRHGSPAEEIVAAASELQVDFVLLGKANRPRIERLLLGDVARQVVENSPAPTILVEHSDSQPPVT